MTQRYNLSTRKTWSETKGDLAEQFRRWNVTRWSLNDYKEARYTGTVTLSYELRGNVVSLTMGRQDSAEDNIRVLYLAVEAMRLNEARGIGDIMQAAYLQLAAPVKVRDPYEVLGIRPDTPLAVAEAAYKALAKTVHPDAGGSVEAMKELNDAIERVKSERACISA